MGTLSTAGVVCGVLASCFVSLNAIFTKKVGAEKGRSRLRSRGVEGKGGNAYVALCASFPFTSR